MEKQKLISFISKYSLGGNIQAAEWSLSVDTLSTRFMSDDNNAIGEIHISNIENASYKHDEKFGIANTPFLLKMLSALEDLIDISLTAKAGSIPDTLKISDGQTEINYMIADPAIIPNVPTPKNLPDPTYEFAFDKVEFVEKFIKAKAAFGDANTFMINPKKKGIEIVIGNTVNKIKIAVKSDLTGIPTRPISFNAEYFKEMLSSNKEMITASFSVFERGMAKINFVHTDAVVTYFLTEMV